MSVSSIPDTEIFNKANREAILQIIEHAASLGAGNLGSGVYVTFLTRSKTLGLPDFLLQKYPEAMTIVLEHQFSNLHVDRDRQVVTVTLSFSNRSVTLNIPFGDIVGLSDQCAGTDSENVEMTFPIVIQVVPDVVQEKVKPIVVETDGNVTRVTFGKKSS